MSADLVRNLAVMFGIPALIYLLELASRFLSVRTYVRRQATVEETVDIRLSFGTPQLIGFPLVFVGFGLTLTMLLQAIFLRPEIQDLRRQNALADISPVMQHVDALLASGIAMALAGVLLLAGYQCFNIAQGDEMEERREIIRRSRHRAFDWGEAHRTLVQWRLTWYRSIVSVVGVLSLALPLGVAVGAWPFGGS
jgi:hypothetical protein